MIETAIIGAGPAGLSVAACLKRAGREVAIIERADTVGSAWRGHYDRLHLHTDKRHSELPYHPFPRDYPKYPSRDELIAYLESYAAAAGLAPQLGETVTHARRGDGWELTTTRGSYRARNLVVATGYTQVPEVPAFPGRDAYAGEVIHSSAYRNGAAYRGRRALVVGFGNSGGEIAIDLVEHGAATAIAVRSPVNVVKRDVLGLPILAIAGLLAWLAPRIADALAWPINRLTVGDIRKLGLQRPALGPMCQIAQTGRVPVLDIGTLDLLRGGKLELRRGIAQFERDEVVFDDGSRGRYDLVVLATGYRPGVAQFLAADGVLDPRGRPITSGKPAAPGLYFCGFYVSPIGMLREIAREARSIAADITR